MRKIILCALTIILAISCFGQDEKKARLGYIGKTRLTSFHTTLYTNLPSFLNSGLNIGGGTPVFSSNNISVGCMHGMILSNKIVLNTILNFRKTHLNENIYSDNNLLYTNYNFKYNNRIVGFELNYFFQEEYIAPLGFSLFLKYENIYGSYERIKRKNLKLVEEGKYLLHRYSFGIRRTLVLKQRYFFTYSFSYGDIGSSSAKEISILFDNYRNWAALNIDLAFGAIW